MLKMNKNLFIGISTFTAILFMIGCARLGQNSQSQTVWATADYLPINKKIDLSNYLILFVYNNKLNV